MSCECHDHCTIESQGRDSVTNPAWRRALWIALVLNLTMFIVELAAAQHWRCGAGLENLITLRIGVTKDYLDARIREGGGAARCRGVQVHQHRAHALPASLEDGLAAGLCELKLLPVRVRAPRFGLQSHCDLSYPAP